MTAFFLAFAYTRERYHGAFSRSITLPASVDEGKISAESDNGLLEIIVQGGAVATVEPRRIVVRGRSSRT